MALHRPPRETFVVVGVAADVAGGSISAAGAADSRGAAAAAAAGTPLVAAAALRSAARMPNYDFIYTMCRYDLSNGNLYVSMPVPEDDRYWVVHVHNNNTNVVFKINNLEIDTDRYELLITNDENNKSSIKTINTTNKGTVFWRLLVNSADEISMLDNQRRSTVCEYR